MVKDDLGHSSEQALGLDRAEEIADWASCHVITYINVDVGGPIKGQGGLCARVCIGSVRGGAYLTAEAFSGMFLVEYEYPTIARLRPSWVEEVAGKKAQRTREADLSELRRLKKLYPDEVDP